MTGVTYPDVGSPAEACAASLCWLARFKVGVKLAGEPGGDRIAAKVEGYWHNKACRYCPVPLGELIRRIQLANTALEAEVDRRSLEAFQRLPPKARTARVREAQEVAWYDAVTAG